MRLDSDARRPRSTLAALVVIALGLAYLARSFAGLHLGALWAAVFFVPALASFAKAWQSRALPSRAAAFTLAGVAAMLLGSTFLLNLPWNVTGPLLLIVLGLSWLSGARR